MGETALVRHMVAKVTMDTSDTAKGARAVAKEVANVKAHFERLEETKKSLANVNTELSKMEKHLDLAWRGSDRFSRSARKDILERISLLRGERSALIDVLQAERNRAANLAKTQARYMGNLNSAIASAAGFESTAPALGGAAGMFSATGGVKELFKDVKQFSTLIKGGGVLLGITQLTHMIRSLREEMERLGDAGASANEKSMAFFKRLPGFGLIIEAAEFVDPTGEFAEQREAKRRAESTRQYMAKSGDAHEAVRLRREEIEAEMKLRALPPLDAKVQTLKDELATKIHLIEQNQYLYALERDSLILLEKKNAIDEIRRIREADANEFADKQNDALIEYLKNENEAIDSIIASMALLNEERDRFLRDDFGFGARQASGIKNTEKAQKAFNDEAEALFDQTRTPMERYEIEMRKLVQFLEDGLISSDVFARRAGQLSPLGSTSLPAFAQKGTQAAFSAVNQKDPAKEKLAEIAKIEAEALKWDMNRTYPLLEKLLGRTGGVADI